MQFDYSPSQPVSVECLCAGRRARCLQLVKFIKQIKEYFLRYHRRLLISHYVYLKW